MLLNHSSTMHNQCSLASGNWNNSTHCSSFTFNGNNSVLNVNGNNGVRLVQCDMIFL